MKRLVALVSVLLVFVMLLASCSTEKEIKFITVEENSITTEYTVGDTPDFSGIKVVVTYVDGSMKVVDAKDLVIGGLDTSTEGEKTLSIKYRGVETTVKINVKAKTPPAPTLVGIAVVPGSVSNTVYVGDKHDLSSLQVEATYSDGSKKAVNVSDLTITEIDTTTSGAKSLVIEYEEKTATVPVTVVGVSEIQIYAGTLANKVYVGDTLNTSGVSALVTYTNGTTETVTYDKLTFSQLDTSSMGDKTLDITYRGFTTQHAVKVVGLVDIEVNNVPTSVRVFGTLDTTGITVNAVYSDQTKLPVNSDLITTGSIDTSVAGAKTLKVSYSGIEKEFTVNVVGVQSMAVVGGTLKNEVILGGTLVTENTTVNVTFTDTTVDTVSFDKLTFGQISTATVGATVLEITYLDKTIDFPVTVCGYKGIRVEGVPLSVKAGEELDLSQMKVYLEYTDTEGTSVLLTEGITTNAGSLNFDNTEDKTLTVTYNGAHGTFTKDVPIAMTEPDFVGLRVESYNSKVAYKETYAPNLKVFAVYGNGAEKSIDASLLTVSNIDTSVAGDKTLTVSYTENGVTQSKSLAVKVLAITSLVVTNMPTQINAGEAIDTSAIFATVTFGEGAEAVEKVITVDTGLTLSAITGVGDQTVKASYEGFEVSLSLHVKAMVSMTILTGTLPEYVRYGYEVADIDKPNVKVEITYTDTTKKIFSLSELSGATLTATHTGDYTGLVTVSYTGDNGTMTATASIAVLKIVSINALNGTVPTTVLKDGVLDYSKMQLTVIYKDASGKNFVYAIDRTDSKLTITEIDTSTTGDKAIIFTFADFEETASIIVTVKGVDNITLVPGSINTTVNVNTNPGAVFDTSSIQVRVEFTDGTYIYADTTDINLKVGSIDISTEGTKILVVSYLGKEASIEIEVKSYTTSGKIYGATLPDSLTARDAYKKNFKEQNSFYVVGDDNPYYFYLSLLKLDQNFEIIDIDGSKTSYNANVYLIDNGETLLEGDALTSYVSIDYETNGYDFTENAIGKLFRIEIWPEDESTCAVDAQSLKRSHIVKVVDAYNIYDEKEFNIITNIEEDVNGGSMEGYLSRQEAVNNFLAENEIVRPNRLAGIVLHRNMNVKVEDVPSEYLYEYKQNGKTEKGFYDQLGLFERIPTVEDPTFTMWGNYYSVFTYNLPCIVPAGVANNDDQYSSSDVFHFDGLYTAQWEVDKKIISSGLEYDESKYKVDVKDMAFRDNDPNSNDQSASERHMRGLICLKFRAVTAELENTNIDAYYLSVTVEADDTALTIKNSKLYNAWQGHVFVWNSNGVQSRYGNKQEAPYANYNPVTIDIQNSLLGKCGGPVILCQADEKNYPSNRDSGTYVIADKDSELYSYVTGQEAWFVAVGQTAMAADIKALNGLITGFSQNYVDMFKANGITLAPASFSSKHKIEGVETMNMIMVSMGTEVGVTEGPIIGKLTIDGKVVLDTTNSKLKEYQSSPYTGNGKAPIFQSSDGGTCYYNAVPGVPQDQMLQCLPTDPHTGLGAYLPSATLPDVRCFTGDYMALNVSGIGICLDYYH